MDAVPQPAMVTDELTPGARELLGWLAARPRGYAETMAVWGTHCPRLAVWEDALAGGLVEVVRHRGASTARLTGRGRAALYAASSPSAR